MVFRSAVEQHYRERFVHAGDETVVLGRSAAPYTWPASSRGRSGGDGFKCRSFPSALVAGSAALYASVLSTGAEIAASRTVRALLYRARTHRIVFVVMRGPGLQ